MVSNDSRDLRVVVDLGENALADLGMRFHKTPLFERQGAGLLEETRGQTDLSDVVHESAEMYELLLSFGKTHALRNTSRIDGDGSRMTGRVPVSSVERCHKGRRKREIRSFESVIHLQEILC